jgi:hypothetical protein
MLGSRLRFRIVNVVEENIHVVEENIHIVEENIHVVAENIHVLKRLELILDNKKHFVYWLLIEYDIDFEPLNIWISFTEDKYQNNPVLIHAHGILI